METEPYCRFHSRERKVQNEIPLSDGPGYVYVYYLESDEPDTFYKIGESVHPIKRVEKQWKGIMKKKYYVRHRKYAERLIHLELESVRVYRYAINQSVPVGGEEETEDDSAIAAVSLTCSSAAMLSDATERMDPNIRSFPPCKNAWAGVSWTRTLSSSWEAMVSTR